MKKFFALIVLAVFAAGVLIAICSRKEASVWNSLKNPDDVKLLKQFVAQKEAQANTATNVMPSEISALFKAANRGDWLTLSNSFWKLGERNGNFYSAPTSHGKFWSAVEKLITDLREKIGWHQDDYENRLRGTQWEAVKEVWGAFAGFVVGDEKYSAEFGRDIIDSIPAGSIYFGGTDPGRFIVTAMCQSQPDGIPFFTLTQNALADGTYLDYLRSMYGKKIYIPTQMDSQDCFQEYARSKAIAASGGGITLSGQVDVMGINGLLARVIFDQNTNREFYIEESFPLDWMYPHLEPHGLIMKINRQQLPELSDEIVKQDSAYWTKYMTPMIGDWLNNDTTAEEVAAFAEKIYLKKDLNGFTGDPEFVQNEYSCKMFSKLRSSIAGLYAWRAQHSADDLEKERMNAAADFAFRQSFALCPYSPETVFRYVNLLLSKNKIDDSVLIAKTASKMPEMQGSDGEQIRSLLKQLQQWEQQSKKK